MNLQPLPNYRLLSRKHRLYLKKLRQSRFSLPIFIIMTTLLSTFFLLTSLNSTPHAPKLKKGHGNTLFTANNSIFSADIGTKDGSPQVAFQVNSATAAFTLSGINSVEGKKIDRHTVLYENILPDTDLRYTTLSNGVKEEIIIKSPRRGEVLSPAPSSFLFDLDLTGTTPTTLTARPDGVISLSPTFTDRDGNYLFHFEEPFAYDTTGARTDDVLMQIGEDRSTPNKYYLKLTVDPTWLNDPSRVYPITIDPTIVHDTTTEFSAGTLNRVKDTGTGSVPSLETWYQELTSDEHTVGLWHMNEGSDNTCSGGEDICDSSGNDNDGTFAGTAAFNGSGRLGGDSIVLDGNSDYATISEDDSLDPSEITLEAWININTIQNGNFINKGDNSGYRFRTNANGTITFFDRGATNAITSNQVLTTGTWYHVTAVGGLDGLKIYINGDLDQSNTTAYGGPNTATDLLIGAYNSGASELYFGDLDEVRISNIARTPEEIKSAASHRPSAVYTSDVIDLTTVASWTDLSWDQWGVATGDGETLYSSTDLVAQWNFNETSGTTADNAEGTAALDGTLSGFDSTASQDADPDSSWTADNRRWGTGALQFDGVDSTITINSESTFDFERTNTFSIEAWVKTFDSNYQVIYNKMTNSSPNTGYELLLLDDGTPFFQLINTNTTNCLKISSNFAINDNNWHHIVATYDGSSSASGAKLYIDGIASGSTHTNNLSSSILNDISPTIGSRNNTTYYFNGTIDSTHIYSRALPAHEILSNYNSADIQFQTRVGADTSPDDGSWDAWTATTGETAISSFDGPHQYTISDTGLVGYWPMDETTDDTCSGSEDACDVRGDNHATDINGSTIVDGKFGKARYFESGERVEATHNTIILPSDDMSVEAWVYLHDLATVTGDAQEIVQKDADLTSFQLHQVDYSSEDIFRFRWRDSGGNAYNAKTDSTTITVATHTWYHVVGVREGTGMKIYVNGKDCTASADSPDLADTIYATNPDELRIGASANADDELYGSIDEVRLYNTPLSSSTIHQHYLAGSTGPNMLHPDTATTSGQIFMEGDSSERVETGRPQIDSSTVALWHLDETAGSGAYLHDSTTNANHGTPTGTTLTQGISGKARSFNGSSDYISTSEGATYSIDTFTISAWIYRDSDSGALEFIIDNRDANDDGWIMYLLSTDVVRCSYNTYDADSTTTISVDKWYHVGCSADASNVNIYINGVLENSTAISGSIAETTNARIGARSFTSANSYFPGTIDEVRISNIARTAEEIAESYRLGRDHYLNRTISPTDLSDKSSLPFWIAGDRPGTYLDAMIGESPYANYQPDTNTIGLWHLAEESGSGDYILDSSGNANHGTPTGTIYSEGKIGKARWFDGSDDEIIVPHSTALEPTSITQEAWIYVESSITPETYGGIIQKATATHADPYYDYLMRISTIDELSDFSVVNLVGSWDADMLTVADVIPENQWVHVVGTFDGTNIKAYVNGQLVGTLANSGSTTYHSQDVYIGSFKNLTTGNFPGLIDEVRISDTARSASEIRQAYEVGLRTHPITIDFAATGNSGNLITGSTDYSFTIDATAYGLDSMGSSLYEGDKIIVRENYDGTEYIAQGTVTAVTASTGAITVTSWDSGGTFPSGGYTTNATFFKWQREYWPITDNTLSTHMDAITNLTLRLTNGAEGRTIWLDDLRSNSSYLTDDSGSTITSSTGNQYFQYRAIMTSLDEAVSATLSAVTLDYVENSAPATPSLDTPTDTATNQSLLPVLQTTTTDTDSDYLRYKIELCEDVGMSTNCQTFTQPSGLPQTGWTGQNAQTSTAYTSGTQAIYTLQTALDPSDTYYWRSYAIDPGGSNTWSSTQGSPYSFTTTTAPTAPTTLYTEGSGNPIQVDDLTPEFSAIHNDPDGDSADYYQVEVNSASDFSGTVMWDSGKSSMTTTADTVRSPDISYAGTALSLNGATYYWRIKFWDTLHAEGAVSSTANFTMNYTPSNSSACRIQETSDDSSLTILWTDTSDNEDYYEIERSIDSGGWSDLSTTIPADSTSYEDSTISTSHTYRYRIASYLTSGPTYSDWCYTDTLSIAIGDFDFQGINLEGLEIN